MTPNTPVPDAAVLPELPVVARQGEEFAHSFISEAARVSNAGTKWVALYTIALTPQAPAQAQINSLRDEVERIKREAQERALQYLSDNGQWIEEVARLTKERDEARFEATRWQSNAEALTNLIELRDRREKRAERLGLCASPIAALAQQGDDVRDAARYRWLRQQAWFSSPLAVVVDPKERVKLGSDCPSLDRLDTAIDAAMATKEAR